MKLKDFVKFRKEKFGGVIFDTLREKVFITNETGSEVLELIEKNYSVEKIIDYMEENYDVEKEELKEEIEKFILILKENSIIEDEDKN